MTTLKIDRLVALAITAGVLFSSWNATSLAVDDLMVEKQEAAAPPPEPFLRVDDKGKVVSLELAVRDYEMEDGPRIGLVSVTHIGDRAFYRKLEKVLEQYDVVLYESVLPPGAGGAHGDDQSTREATTRAAMSFVGSCVEMIHTMDDAYPATLDQLRARIRETDPRLGHGLDIALIDAWDHSLRYRLNAETGEYRLLSLGADGKLGGTEDNADLDLIDQPAPNAFPTEDSDNIQAELASALGLSYQLTAMDYDQPNWRLCDMAMDQLQAALDARGADWELLGGTLDGTSLTGRVATVFLRFMRMADGIFDGAISDMMKVVMIEMLGDPELVTAGMTQLGEGFAEALIDDRNQVVIDQVAEIVENEPDVKSVAIFYGAGHMDDLAVRLREQLGYVASGDQWLPAMSVNLEQSAISPRQMLQTRLMFRRMMRQQLGK